MSDAKIDFGPSLKELTTADWITEVEELVAYDGYLTHLGKRHLAAFSEHGPTLLVTFETLQGVQALSPLAHPLGWELVKVHDWSSLTLLSDGDTWFRDPAVYAFFDRLVDDGFFDEFDNVLFYGAGACGYAAAAFSVVSPGARVLTIQPQATLATRLTEWDRRFVEQRRVNFTDRYGYAPDMLEAANHAYVVYDPTQPEDAMHASLFAQSNMSKRRLPNMGAALQTDLLQMGCLFDMINLASLGQLTQARFSKMVRARRDHVPYLRRLLLRLKAEERPRLLELLSRSVTGRMRAPQFER